MVSNLPRVTLVTALTAFDGRDPKATDEKEPATGVLTMASVIRDRFATTVVDLNHIWRRSEASLEECVRAATRAIAATDAEIVGFSSICSTYPTTIRLTKLVARELPNSHIVLGGRRRHIECVSSYRCGHQG